MAMNSRTTISRIEDLQSGDHIVFNTKSDEHHGIVVSVHPDEDVVSVIRARSGGVIESTKIKFSGEKVGPVHVVKYDVEECVPPAQVIDNALGMVGERVGKSSESGNNSGSTVEADGDVDKRPRRPVSSIEDLQPGDHVAFQRRGYEHHGIVISVHPDEDIFNVAEVFKGNEVREMRKIHFATRPHTYSEEKHAVYVVQYGAGECLPNSEVIRNACRLDGESIEYNLFTKNCEHYASAIKTGTAISEQIEDVVAKLGSIASKFLVFLNVDKAFSLLKRVFLKKKIDQ